MEYTCKWLARTIVVIVLSAAAYEGHALPPLDAPRVPFGARSYDKETATADAPSLLTPRGALRLEVATVDTTQPEKFSLATQSKTPRGTLPVLLQYDPGAPDATRAALRKLGCTIHGYVPPHGYLVEVPAAQLEAVRGMREVNWLGAYKPSYKLSRAVKEARRRFERAMSRAGVTNFTPCGTAWPMAKKPMALPEVDQLCPVTVHLFNAQDAEHVATELAVQGSACVGVDICETAAGRTARIRARVPFAALDAIAELAAVQWIEAYRPPELFNNVAVAQHLMNVLPVWATNWLGLTGRGQIVAHADTGIDTGNVLTLHPDFTNRLRAVFGWGRPGVWSDPHGHGTHTAGSLAGNGSALSNGLFKGVAYEAALVHQSLYYDALNPLGGLPTNLHQLFQQAYATNARIYSISWGSAAAGGYTSSSRDVDEFMWYHPDMLIVVAAGNNSDDSDGDGVVSGATIAAPASAKNALTVGAAESDRPAGSGGYSSQVYGSGAWEPRFPVNPLHDDVISTSADGLHQGMFGYSSRGPCADGRIKPDVVAPGTDIISCRSRVSGANTFWGVYDNNYVFSGGTSQATPLTAGAAALVRQYFMEKHSVLISNPSAALIKATLANGARSLSPGQYGYEQFREIPPPPRPNVVEGWGHVDLAPTLTNLMVWDGQTLSNGASATYVVTLNDTNALCATLAWTDYPGTLGAAEALVNDLDLQVMTPNGVVHYPNGLSGPDQMNNVEGVDLNMVPPGVCTVRVSAVVNMGGAQRYALVVRTAAPVVARMAVESVAIEPRTVRPVHAPVVAAVVHTNASGLAGVVLRYRVNYGAWNTVAMAVRTPIETGGVYTNAIPPQVKDSVVELYVVATGNDGVVVTNGPVSYTVGDYAVFVWQGGTQVAPYDTWATGFSNLYQAIASSVVSAGYVIYVTNGVYSARDSGVDDGIIINKAVRIIAVNGPRETVIDGGYGGRCVTIINPNAVLEGFTIRRGYAYYNAGIYGGGVYCVNGTLRKCVIEQCYAQGLDANGAGVALMNGGLLDGCIVRDNQAQGGWDASGGGAYLTGKGVVRSSLFINNLAYSGFNNAGGGNIMIEFGGAVSNCTVVAGSASGSLGGGIGMYRTSMVHNSIVYFNNNGNFWLNNEGSPVAPDFRWNYTCVTPLPSGTGVSGTGNFTNHPRLVNYPGYDAHLLAESPCRNAGELLPWMTNAVDADGHVRVAEGAVDVGAFEFGPLAVSFDAAPRTGLTPLRTVFTVYASGLDTNGLYYHWDFNFDGSNDLSGAQWARPTNVYLEGLYSVALATSNTNGELVFWRRRNFIYAYDTNVHYVAHGGAHVWPFTSFARAATNITDAVNACVSGHSVVISDGVYRLAQYVEVPNGVTIRGLNGRDRTVLDGQSAGPCLMLYAGGIADGLTLSNGQAGSGGGVYFSGGGTLRNARIIKNASGMYGGGAYLYRGGTLEDSIIMNNTDYGSGGGGVCLDSGGLLRNCVVMHNSAYNGGGVYIRSANPTVRNCVIAANTAQMLGGGLMAISQGTVENCTIVDNTATSISGGSGGGVHTANANLTMRNCIVFNNRAAGVLNNISTNLGTVTFQYLCTSPPWGTQWLTNDPRFVNAAARDYRLRADSYCVNHGTNLSWMSGAKDVAGNNRVINGAPDIGAYELNTNVPLLRVTLPNNPHELRILDFGEVWITEAVVRVFAVRNVGGGVLSGELGGVSAPFAPYGSPTYVLGVNSGVVLGVEFAPEAGTLYSVTANLSGGGGATLVLRGLGVPEPSAGWFLLMWGGMRWLGGRLGASAGIRAA